MSVRCAVAGTAIVVILAGALGNPAVVSSAQDLGQDHRSPVAPATLVGLPNWDVFADGTPAEAAWGVVLKLGVLLITAGILAALAGRASRPSAFLAGWASLVVAAALAGAVDFAYRDTVLGPLPNLFDTSSVDRLVAAANTGAGFGLWTGWMVGLAVAATARSPAGAAAAHAPGVPTGRIGRSPGGGPAAPPVTPPAPWWATDASPSPVQYEPPSVRPATEGDDPSDPSSTVATPLARFHGDPDVTRPVPTGPGPPATNGGLAADAPGADQTETDPTVIDRG